MKNKILLFDTNTALKLFKDLTKNTNIDKKFLDELRKNNTFAIFNMTVIELLMRFKRERNITKIRKILNYIHENNIIIGNIQCCFFIPKINKLGDLNELDNKRLLEKIEEMENDRLEFKSTIITLWINCLIEILFMGFIDDKNDYKKVLEFSNEECIFIKDKIFNFFKEKENTSCSEKIKLLPIVNEIYIEVFEKFSRKFKCNRIYSIVKKELNKLDSKQSISYIYKGFFKNIVIGTDYKERIDKFLDEYYNCDLFKEIFYLRLQAFMQGEPLQKNDVEDMLMLSTLELDKNILIITEDNKMRSFLKNKGHDIDIEVCDKILKKDRKNKS